VCIITIFLSYVLLYFLVFFCSRFTGWLSLNIECLLFVPVAVYYSVETNTEIVAVIALLMYALSVDVSLQCGSLVAWTPECKKASTDHVTPKTRKKKKKKDD